MSVVEEPPFADVEAAVAALREAGYVADRDVAVVVFLAGALGRPLLLEGPAGVGKTELAKAVSRATGRPLIRLQCYEGLDEARALYEWEYGKQLLYTQLVRRVLERELGDAADLGDAVRRLAAHESAFYDERFLLARPLLAALRTEGPAVLLVDEVDRSDPELEALLLEILSDYQVTIPELGTVRAAHVPFVVLTSNATRELTEALRRRCLHLHLDYPAPERELEILRVQVPEAGERLIADVVAVAEAARALDLRKTPSVAETADWARALVLVGAESLAERHLDDTLGVLAKHHDDAAPIRDAARGVLSARSDEPRGGADTPGC